MTTRTMTRSQRGILFLCVANSARSQMAEGLARAILPDTVEVQSAGSDPGLLHPVAVAVMEEVGVDISWHRPKSLDSVPIEKFGTVITLCAEEYCEASSMRVHLHWPIADPAAHAGSPESLTRAFRTARDEIERRLRDLVARDFGDRGGVLHPDLDSRA